MRRRRRQRQRPLEGGVREERREDLPGHQKELEKIGKGAKSPDEVADAIDKVIDKSKKAADDLVALERPDGDAGETATEFAEGFKSGAERQDRPGARGPEGGAQGEGRPGRAGGGAKLQKLESSKSDKAARELGATACVGSA